MRLIDADAERDGFMEMVYEQLSDDPDNIRANLIIDYYDSLPTVEPVRGEWIDGTDGCKHCSKCGAVADETMMQWNNLYFCYHCGADMRKKVE